MHLLIKSTLATISGLLIVLSFPNWSFYGLVWFALCPLIWANASATLYQRLVLGLITGGVSTLGIYYWIFEVDAFRFYHGILLTSYLAIFVAIWSVFCDVQNSRLRPLVFSASLWVILEFLQANMGFLALPWGQLGHSQHLNLTGLQIVAITGDYGLSFLIVLFNLALYQLLKFRRLSLSIVIVFVLTITVHIYGWLVLQSVEKNSFKIAIIQPNFNTQLTQSEPIVANRLEQLQQMSLKVVTEQVDLVVWPETAVRNLANNVLLQKELHSIVDFIAVPLITGASEIAKFSVANSKNVHGNYNSAFFLKPGKQGMQRYDKTLLVPFAESVPFKEVIHWPEWILSSSFDTTPGRQTQSFKINENTKFSVLICWENLFHKLLFKNTTSNPDFFIHISNLNWFGLTAASRQHNAISVIRAVEFGRPIIVASNSGPSQLISSNGVIIKRLDKHAEAGVLVGSIYPHSQSTFFSKFHFWFVILCLFFVFKEVLVKNK